MTWNAVIVFASVGLVNAVVFAVLDGLGCPRPGSDRSPCCRAWPGSSPGRSHRASWRASGVRASTRWGILASGVALVPLTFSWVVPAVAAQALLAFVDYRVLVLANVVVVIGAGLVALRLPGAAARDASDAQVTRGDVSA